MWCLPSVRPNVSEMFKCSTFHRPILKQRPSAARFSTTSSPPYLPPLFSIAPMMEWTDNHYRTLARIITKHAWLYTEMIAAQTLVHQQTNLDRFLAFSPEQHPIVLQLGGSNVESLAKAAKLSHPYGYDEINLNCGCPSPKVAGHGCFGVSLMLNPKLVGEAMSAIAGNTNVPVTVKCRIGVDDHDSYDELCDFVYKVSALSPTRHFIVHSRKALLGGISPADNRRIPPLKYEYYYALVRDFPDLRFTINGGITSVSKVNAALKEGAHGVMVGRAAYNNPWQTLGLVDTAVYGVPSSGLTRRQVLEQYQVYADSVLGTQGNGRPNVRDLVKPLLNIFHSENGNSLWKRRADAAFRECKTVGSLLEESLKAIPDSVLDSPISASPEIGEEEDEFAQVHNVLPPPYEAVEQVILCA
uniref:tRNA-dihydrouridine synthase A n=1 Tax=Noccaea caerulescens TaxID=107243 RepID=A0A1J3HAQ9_NOCCA